MLLGIIGHRTRPHDIYRLLSISHWIFNQLGRARERARGEKQNIIIIKNIREKLRGKDEERGMKKKTREKRVQQKRRERDREKDFCVFLNLILATVPASPILSSWFVSQTTTKWARPNSINTFRVRPLWLCVCVSRPILDSSNSPMFVCLESVMDVHLAVLHVL